MSEDLLAETMTTTTSPAPGRIFRGTEGREGPENTLRLSKFILRTTYMESLSPNTTLDMELETTTKFKHWK